MISLARSFRFAARFRLVLVVASLFAIAVAGPVRADDGLRRVRANRELIIATDATYPPFEFKENDAGDKLVGFDIEVGDEIAREMGVKVRWLPMEWAGVLASLETGKCDLVMSSVTITGERKKGNAFSRPYFLSGQVIARRKGETTISGPDDLLAQNRIIAVQQETTGQFAMEKRGLPKDRIRRFDQMQDALLEVRNKRADAAVGDLPALAEMIRKGYPEIELASTTPFVQENIGVVGRRDARDLIGAVNAALDRIIADGRYARIYQKWMFEPVTTGIIARLDAAQKDGTPIPAEISAAGAKTLGAVAGAVARPGADDAGASAASGSALTIRWDILRESLPKLLRGAGLTLWLTLLTLLLGVPLGLLIALARMTPFAPLRVVAATYVEAVRGTPLLMQIYVIYFVFAAGISLPAFLAGLLALSLNAGAYVSEIFRGGIESIEVGQMEAARSLGMTQSQAMRFVILPQTVRRVLPPLTNEAVALLKDSSLVSVVALSELMRAGKEIATNSGSPTTIYLAVALLYLAMTLPLTFLVRRLEARWRPISRSHVAPEAA